MALQYFLGLILAASGLVAGVIISLLAKEELKAGKKYFLWLEDIILLVFIYFIWQKDFLSPLFFWPIVAILLLTMIHPSWTEKHAKWFKLRNSLTPYFLFAFLLATTSKSPSFEVFTTLTFLWGIPAASRWVAISKKWKYHVGVKIVALIGFGTLFWFLPFFSFL